MADCILYNSDYINFKIFLINMQYFFSDYFKGKAGENEETKHITQGREA